MNQDLHSPHSIDGNLSQLKNSELHTLLQNRVADERKLTSTIVISAAEVASRQNKPVPASIKKEILRESVLFAA